MTIFGGRTETHMGLLRRAVNTLAFNIAVIAMAVTLSLAPASAQSTMDKRIKIVAFGDSLTAGFMLAPEQAFPAVLDRALKAMGYDIELVNAGVSGDTTSGARERLAWAVPADTDGVIVELGANDALRGINPAITRRNLDAIIKDLVAAKHEILLAGMLAPRSLGEDFSKPFDAIYPELASQYGLLLYPFFIEKTALNLKLSLSDGLHPNAKGIEAIVADILPKVEELIARIKSRRIAAQKG